MISKLIIWARTQRFLLLFFGIIFFVLLLNCVHNSYPDEFDNILGGFYINHGILPYTGFFSHHGPLAYFLAAIMVAIGGRSFVHFRLLTVPFYFLIFLVTFLLGLRRIGKTEAKSFLFWIFFIALGATYFWGHMFLADPLSGYFLIPGYFLLWWKIFHKSPLTKTDLTAISISVGAAVINSVTYIYAGALVALTTIFYASFYTVGRFSKKSFILALKASLIIAIPFLLFFGYLMITGSLSAFRYEAITYNQKYYVYFYEGAAQNGVNPIRYGIVILNNFINLYQPLLLSLSHPDFSSPLRHTFALTNFLLVAYLIWKKKYFLTGVTFLTLVFITTRGSPDSLKVTDYQSAVYIMLSTLNASLLIGLINDLTTSKDAIIRGFFTLLGVAGIILWINTIIFLFGNIWRISFDRYMGKLPLIYDRPQVAPLVNAVVPPSHYCWVGPFEFEELLYLNCKLPSHYHWILPQFANAPEIKSELLADYTKNRADVIIFSRDFSAFNQSSDFNHFFTDFLDHYYVRVANINGKKYQFKHSLSKNFNLNDSFNIEKSQAKEIVAKLLSLGELEEVK